MYPNSKHKGEPTVETEITIVDSSDALSRSLEGVFVEKRYRVTCLNASGVKDHLRRSDCKALIIDLDNVPVDILFFRQLKRSHPEMKIVVVSRHPYHPELEEAMSRHIFASISKPVDPDEIEFLLKNIADDADLP